MLSSIAQKIRDNEVVVSVMGLGRVGLPLSIVLSRSGLHTYGIDINEDVVKKINAGIMPSHYPAMHEWLERSVSSHKLEATTNSTVAFTSSDVIIITVGTPINAQLVIDYEQLRNALRSVIESGLSNKCVIIRSTSSPGTFKRIIQPFLQNESHLHLGGDFALAVCPERILEGQAHHELYSLPEIVGADDDISFQIAEALFKHIDGNKHVLRTTPTGAELAKLFTNIYRYVNFALGNEFAIWTEKYGEDANEIVKLCNNNYPRAHIASPGFAGGPCLGKDAVMLDNGTTFTSIISVAWKLNEGIPQHVVSSLLDVFGSICGLKITILGLAFKANSDDVRLSPSAKLIQILQMYGAQVTVHDPHVIGTESLSNSLLSPDVVILATNHLEFRELAKAIDESGCKIIYDVWGMFEPNEFRKAQYMRFGRH